MKQFAISTEIHATPEAIWQILVDLPNWIKWNTTIEKVEGTVAAGGRVKVYTKLSPGQAFPVQVAELQRPSRMVWQGGMPLGLFRGVRTYSLKPIAGGTLFEMTEVFSGLMAPLITRSIPNLQPSFEEFARCLKRHAEQAAASPV